MYGGHALIPLSNLYITGFPHQLHIRSYTRRMLNIVGEWERPNLGFVRDVRAA